MLRLALLLGSSASLLVACAPSTVEMPIDGDADGLMDDEEAANGTDPMEADSDGDDWLDGLEVANFTDPLDPDDHPYTGGWDIGACRYDVEPSGSPEIGGVAPAFSAPDQYGDDVRLHDFCHNAVLVVTGSEWCGPCQAYRSTMASFWDSYRERGLMIVDLLMEDINGAAPTQEVLERWADGHHYAVLADPGGSISFAGGYVNGGIPAISLLGPGGEIVILNGNPQASDIEAVLPW